MLAGMIALAVCGTASSAARTATTRPCLDSEIALNSPAQVEGITGTEIIVVVIRDVSRARCTLRGYPVIRLFGPGLRRISPLVTIHGEAGPKEPKRVQTELLVPHRRAVQFDLSFEDHPSPEPAADCRRIAAVAARLPRQSVWLSTKTPLRPTECMGRPLHVSVSPIGLQRPASTIALARRLNSACTCFDVTTRPSAALDSDLPCAGCVAMARMPTSTERR